MPNTSAIMPLPDTRPLQKCVEFRCLCEWVPEQARRSVDLTRAWRIIKSQYCAALVSRGVCPIQCERCKPYLIDMFQLEQAVNPEALLTWRAKDGSARHIEILIAAQKADEQLPTLEDPYAALFPKREETDLIMELRKLYAG